MKILLATRNVGKIKEMRSALSGLDVELLTVDSVDESAEPRELENSYEENAVIKALHYPRLNGSLVIADDSGLEVDALDGRPGVVSARYGGPNLSDQQRVKLLLNEMKNARNRSARFVCVVAVVGDYDPIVVRGTCDGRIGMAPRGSNGFGYDPIFIPDNYEQTFAELPDSLKNRISHRGKALQQVKERLGAMLLDQ